MNDKGVIFLSLHKTHLKTQTSNEAFEVHVSPTLLYLHTLVAADKSFNHSTSVGLC